MHERLYRSRTDRVLFGVAGGIADWLDVDPSVVRLVWVILVLFGGAGLLLYIIAAIVIPEEPYEAVGMPPGMAGMPAGAVAGTTPGAPGDAASGATGAVPGTGVTPPPGAVPTTAWTTYAEARAARRAERAARRAERGNGAGIVFGVILILVGGWFLLRTAIPTLDDRWLGPGVLVVIGLLLVVAAVRRPGPPA